MAGQRSVEWFTARRGKLKRRPTCGLWAALLGEVSYFTLYTTTTTSRAVALRRALGTDEFKGSCATEHGSNNEMNGVADYQLPDDQVMTEATSWIPRACGCKRPPARDHDDCRPETMIGGQIVVFWLSMST
eukprot:scaffold27005_cov132-Isochrysis_galbana.AAC.2